MPIPSWEELRQLAEQVSESKKPSEISTGELAAKGFSDFVSKLLTARTPTQHYTGALTKEGEFIIASNSGSQLPHIVFTSPNVILVVGAQKIVPNLEKAIKRLETYVLPLEDENMKQKYGAHTLLSKMLVYHRERQGSGRKITIVIVKEKLGF